MFTTVFSLLTISFGGVVYFVLRPTKPTPLTPKEDRNDNTKLTSPTKPKAQTASPVAASHKKSKTDRSKQPAAPKREQESVQEFEYRKGKIVYRLERHTFLTRSHFVSCTAHHHNLIDIYGRVAVVMSDKIRDVRFPATYCQTCDKFFILEHVYQWLRAHGRVLCKVVTQDYWTPKLIPLIQAANPYGDLESKLHALGYNVNAQVGLSKAQRRALLRQIIVNHEMTRSEVESHLAYLIRRNQSNANFQRAIDKWYSDLLYIENLDFNYSRIPMTAVRVKRRHY